MKRRVRRDVLTTPYGGRVETSRGPTAHDMYTDCSSTESLNANHAFLIDLQMTWNGLRLANVLTSDFGRVLSDVHDGAFEGWRRSDPYRSCLLALTGREKLAVGTLERGTSRNEEVTRGAADSRNYKSCCNCSWSWPGRSAKPTASPRPCQVGH
jgi:hypothetical protein